MFDRDEWSETRRYQSSMTMRRNRHAVLDKITLALASKGQVFQENLNFQGQFQRFLLSIRMFMGDFNQKGSFAALIFRVMSC
jgi:hypothetical protein